MPANAAGNMWQRSTTSDTILPDNMPSQNSTLRHLSWDELLERDMVSCVIVRTLQLTPLHKEKHQVASVGCDACHSVTRLKLKPAHALNFAGEHVSERLNTSLDCITTRLLNMLQCQVCILPLCCQVQLLVASDSNIDTVAVLTIECYVCLEAFTAAATPV